MQTGPQSPGTPLIQPTTLPSGSIDPTTLQNPTFPDPTARLPLMTSPGVPGVRLSLDDPTAHIDQDWTVTFEGVLPGADQTRDRRHHDRRLSLADPPTGTQADAPGPATGLSTPGYCSLGIEDWTLGQARAEAIEAKNPADAWTSDYIEITDDLLPEDVQYWGQPSACWDSSLSSAQRPVQRVLDAFGANGTDAGATGVGTLADTYLRATSRSSTPYDDHLVLGRFGWDPRSRRGRDHDARRRRARPEQRPVPEDRPVLLPPPGRLQGAHRRRVGDRRDERHQFAPPRARRRPDGSCTLSCDTQDALLNGRLLDTPRSTARAARAMPTDELRERRTTGPPPQRLSTRCGTRCSRSTCRRPVARCPTGRTRSTARDLQWHFSVRGGFDPLTLSITQGGQRRRRARSRCDFIEPLGRLAVVDGEQQGLVVFDLYTLEFATGPFY